MFDSNFACLSMQIPLPAYLKDILLENGPILKDGLVAGDGAAADDLMMTAGSQDGEPPCLWQA